MHDREHLFLQTDASVREVADFLLATFELEPIPNQTDDPNDIGLRGPARTADAVVGFEVRANGFAMVDPEPDEVQAIDDYPIEIAVWLGKDEGAQLAEARLVFDRLVGAWSAVPMLLCHDIDVLVAAYLPGRGVHEFPDGGVSIDVGADPAWRGWIRSAR
jgi:hypothetical protein